MFWAKASLHGSGFVIVLLESNGSPKITLNNGNRFRGVGAWGFNRCAGFPVQDFKTGVGGQKVRARGVRQRPKRPKRGSVRSA